MKCLDYDWVAVNRLLYNRVLVLRCVCYLIGRLVFSEVVRGAVGCHAELESGRPIELNFCYIGGAIWFGLWCYETWQKALVIWLLILNSLYSYHSYRCWKGQTEAYSIPKHLCHCVLLLILIQLVSWSLLIYS